MASKLVAAVLNASLPSVTVIKNTSILNTTSLHSHLQTGPMNTSLKDGCIEIRFNEMDFIPWDNPDNIVSAEVESITSRIKDNALGLLFLIGAPANMLNMAVFYKQGLKDRINMCLFALSLVDELFLVSSMLFNGEQLFLQFTTEENFGPITTFLANTNLTFLLSFYDMSIILSAIIASERCLCILSPLKFQTLLQTRTMAVIIVVIYTLVSGLFFVVSFRYRIGCAYDPVSGARITTFVVGEVYRRHKQFIDHLDGFVFAFSLPILVTMVVITTTGITTVKLREVITWRTGTSSALSSREVALTKMLIGNSVFFAICMIPCCVNRFSWLFFPDMNSGGRYHNFFLTNLWITDMLTLINSTFNIIVYYAMGSRYRQTVWALFSRKLKLDNA